MLGRAYGNPFPMGKDSAQHLFPSPSCPWHPRGRGARGSLGLDPPFMLGGAQDGPKNGPWGLSPGPGPLGPSGTPMGA